MSATLPCESCSGSLYHLTRNVVSCRWARGGGWQGPYISGGGNGAGGSDGGGAAGELWEDINVFVISRWVVARLRHNTTLPDEAAVFAQYCTEVLGLPSGSGACATLRKIALGSSEAVLHMHYCEVYDSKLQPATGGKGGIPTNNWMRDDCLGGSSQVAPVFAMLEKTDGFPEALAEKAKAVTTWARLRVDAASLRVAVPDNDADTALVAWRQHLETGTVYGECLARIIEAGWSALAIGYQHTNGAHHQPLNKAALQQALGRYDAAWAAYNGFRIANPFGATLYKDTYSHGAPGIGVSVDALRKLAKDGEDL